jgi:hypothetical protein
LDAPGAPLEIMTIKLRATILLLVLVSLPLAALAHVGSPDIYYQGPAGPYSLMVTIRPPAVIPGVAEIEVHSVSPGVTRVEILPMQMGGPGANLAPTPDRALPLANDPSTFSGKLWIMARGSWKVQINADGDKGKGTMAVPVAAVATTSFRMQRTLGILLSVLGLLLALGLVGIIGAANRDADLGPDQPPSPAQIRRARWRMGTAAVLVVTALFLADWWWGTEAEANAQTIYKLPHVAASLQPGSLLQLTLDNPNASPVNQFRMERWDRLRLDDLVPDHGHLVHLFLVRMPDMQSFWHLHPAEAGTGEFFQALPAMPAGHYQIYADIVHQSGFPETQVGTLDLDNVPGRPLMGDDSGQSSLAPAEKVAQLADGYRMVWERDASPLKAKQPMWFRFLIEDQNGAPAKGVEQYMGMAGHAVFMSNDGKAFAHIHPSGSVSMAALNVAQGAAPDASMSSMAGMDNAARTAEVSFLYGFPQAGDYRIFVQVKRAGAIATGSFLAHVEN